MEKQQKQSSQNNRLSNAILNDPNSARRIGIKKAEEVAKEASRNRRINAPKTIEESILFHR